MTSIEPGDSPPPVPGAAPPWTPRPASDAGVTAQDTAVTEAWVAQLRLNPDGLLPAVVQEATTRAVLMLAWMDVEALRRTLATQRATYWSRSRQQYWVKGETSGHHQHVREVRLDCDGDTLLVVVDQSGPACHTGSATCFDAAELSLSPEKAARG